MYYWLACVTSCFMFETIPMKVFKNKINWLKTFKILEKISTLVFNSGFN